MKHPATPRPYGSSVFTETDDGPVKVGLLHVNKETNEEFLVAQFPFAPEEGIDEAVRDSIFVAEACNMYQPMIELLESVEATTTDKAASRKIRNFLNRNNLWS